MSQQLAAPLQPQLVETSLFDTSALAPQDRFQAWRDSIGVLFKVDPFEAHAADQFNARLDSFLLDDIMICRSWLGSQTYARAPAVANDGIDHYLVHVYLRGAVDMQIGRSRVEARQARFVNIDLADDFRSETGVYEMLSAFIPRRRLAPMLDHPDSTNGLNFDSQSGAGKLLYDYLWSLFEAAPGLARSQAPEAAKTLLDLSAMAMNGVAVNPEDPPDVANQSLFFQARNLIARQLADPALSPDVVAAQLGLSRTRLYGLFRERGGPAAYIRELRLRRCFADLISAREAHLQVAQIAYRWGFLNLTHFSRQFRARFGAQPSDLRAHGAEQIAREALGARDAAGDSKYAVWIASLG